MKWSITDSYDERYFLDYDLDKLGIDEFFMNISFESFGGDVYLYTLNRQCIECPYIPTHYEKESPFQTNLKFRIATVYEQYLAQNQFQNVICDIDYNFEQFGVYNINKNGTECSVETLLEPVNIYTPILTVILIYTILFATCWTGYQLWRGYIQKRWNEFFGIKEIEKEDVPVKSRIKSLDTFRGIVMVVMIFANFGCGQYHRLNHAKWNGLHMADLVFPSFIWIMGACIPISLFSNFKKGVSNITIIKHVLVRSIKLFAIGIVLGSGTNLQYLRIFGVLQRFGVAYGVVSIIFIYSVDRNLEIHEDYINKYFKDILILWKGWCIMLTILFIHTVIIFIVAAPGCPRGYMGPGGLHKNRSYEHCIGGATGYLDGLILGNHAYQHPTIYEVYESKPFDPEGVVGCLPTIFHVFIGVQVGTIIMIYKKHTQRIIRWLIWGTITGLVGGALCGFSNEDGLIPVNKNLWSLSFVMVTSCFAFFLLSICYITIDIKQCWSGKPFLFAGMNAILIYIGHEIAANNFPFRWSLGTNYSSHFVALLADIWTVGGWVVLSYYLYNIKYFFTV